VNEDGTTARITNWDQMTAREQQITLKRIGARNAERLKKLRATGVDGGAPEGEHTEAQAREADSQSSQPGAPGALDMD
jgi:predicted Fe-S protein YdhL (DUF1289 family)